MKLKIWRHEFDITEKDVLFDNGACYQLTTQTYGCGLNLKSPIVSKTLLNY